jgi:hypothetical protein
MRWKKGNRLKLVSEADAPAPVRAIFDEVRHCLGVPSVPMLYLAYGAMPEFLELHWKAFKPVLQTRQFFGLGTRLAAEAYTRAQSYFEVPDLHGDFGVPDGTESVTISEILDYYQYLDPLLLLITVAQMQALEGVVGQEGAVAAEPSRHPEFVRAPVLADASGDSSALGRIWEERQRSLNLAFVPEEHRAMAMWPDIYQRSWLALQELVHSPLYADCQFRIGESAWSLVRELPVQVATEIPVLLEAGLSDEQISSLARINESLIAALTSLLLEVTFTRIAGEGGSHAALPGHRPETTLVGGRQRNSQAA